MKYLLLLSIFFYTVSCAQITVVCNKHTYTIPSFKEDSVQSFNNRFVKEGIIAPITQSDAIIEIRLFFAQPHKGIGGRIFIIKYFLDSIVGEETEYVYDPPDTKPTPPEFIIGKLDGRFVIIKGSYILSAEVKWDSVLNLLIKNKAFELPNHNKIINELKSKDLLFKDPYAVGHHPRHIFGPNILEIKLQSHYRNIDIDYPYNLAFNDKNNNPYFDFEAQIIDAFYSIFNNLNYRKNKKN